MGPSLLSRLLAVPFRIIPAPAHCELLARVANHLMRGQVIEQRLRELDGKSVCIRFTDIPGELRFSIKDRKLVRSSNPDWDVRISGPFHDFLLLATRAEDPDTLFFNRRLNIEGDTETGLYIKNTLDSLEYDWPAHFTAITGMQPPAGLSKLTATIIKSLRDRRLPTIPKAPFN